MMPFVDPMLYELSEDDSENAHKLLLTVVDGFDLEPNTLLRLDAVDKNKSITLWLNAKQAKELSKAIYDRACALDGSW